MKDNTTDVDAFIRIGRRIYNKLNHNNRGAEPKEYYFDKKIYTGAAGNDLIFDCLQANKPFAVSRLGHVELSCLINFHEIKELAKYGSLQKKWHQIKGKSANWDNHISTAMQRNAGFFPSTPPYLQRFSEFYLKCLPSIDIMAVWYNYYEDVICHQYCANASLIELKSIEPYYFNNPWSKYLEGRKVLVIHPFEKSIRQQFAKRELLFEDKDVLPAFTLETIKAVQSIAFSDTTFSDWFEALESMKTQMRQADFDIALIGAGAYGLPLAAYAKELGKQAIHFGGSLQILFGIKGSRWDQNPAINKYYNEHWIRPLQEETPGDFKKVEGGCYW